MSIESLLAFVGKQNIADELDEETLNELGERVKRQFDEDLDSMSEWIESVEEGLKLMKQEYKPKSMPWQGASNFKSPMLSEASIAFGDRATLEILRPRNLVKADVIGRDVGGKKKELAERVTEAMNYQINYQMREWREDQERMFYVLPNVGTMFKKPVFDPQTGKATSYVIHYPDFAVNQATTCIDSARSFTQILDVDANGQAERMAAGLWSDIEIYPNNSEGDKGSNEEAGTKKASENPDRFLEQYCFADLDDDGYEEPYIVTIHESTRQVMRVVARYDEQSFIVRTPEGRVMNMVEAIKRQTEELIKTGMATPQTLPDTMSVAVYKLICIQPNQNIVKYGFIPAPDGTFLDLGYAHMLGAITQGVNTTTNQLTDAGTLRNVGGGFLAKGFRKKMGPSRIKPGEYLQTDIPAKDLQTGIMPNPSPEPSTVLYQLNEKLEAQGRNFAAIVDNSGQITANTAPTTALAMIQESMISTSALMGRMLRGMSKEFQILHGINKRTFDPELYKKILDEPAANALADFNNESLDIVPTASPEMSSKLQRIQLSEVEMSQVPMVIQAGGNPKPIVENFFKRIGSDNIEEIFPEEPTDQQAAEIKRFREAQELQNQLQAQQVALNELQTQILMREQDRLDAETKIKIEKAIGELEEMRSDTILNLERAETEQAENQISMYTAQIKGIVDMLTAIGAANDRAIDRRNQIQAGQAPNIQGSV